MNRENILDNTETRLNIMNLMFKWDTGKALTKIENLPSGLASYYVYQNNITEIKNLPVTLRNLQCYTNNISKINNLPPDLKLLHISENQITKIENLPWHLEDIWIQKNEIVKIINLPNTLNLFFFDPYLIKPRNDCCKTKVLSLKSIIIDRILTDQKN